MLLRQYRKGEAKKGRLGVKMYKKRCVNHL